MKTNFANIPQELKPIPHWVVWRCKLPKKLPYNPVTGEPAEANNPATWGIYDSAVEAFKLGGYDGIGFELGTGDNLSGYTVIDLDHVLENGQLPHEYIDIVKSLDSYTEISQSGEGLHIFVRGQKPGPKCRNEKLEIYDRDRFIAMTGDIYGNRSEIMPGTVSLSALYEQEFGPDYVFELPAKMPMKHIDDNTVLDKARNSAKGKIFSDLYDRGDISAYSDDNSAADLALCNYLAYWTNCDEEHIDRLFRSSALYRDKWDSKRGDQTYGQITISKAVFGMNPSAIYAPTVNTYDVSSKPAPREGSSAAFIDKFDEQLEKIKSQPKILTGFPGLDGLLDGGILPETIIVAGHTGTGKTGFALQIADHIAASGQDVLYFALEMSPFELISKSISRISFLNGSGNLLTARDVMFSKVDGRLTDNQSENMRAGKMKYFSEVGPNIFIPDTTNSISIDDVIKYIDNHVKENGKPALLVIDYLQLLAPTDLHYSDKQNIDVIMRGLKHINMQYGIPVLAISSLNRQAYTDKNGKMQQKDVQLSGLKESGSIEYTGNIILGLNASELSEISKRQKITINLLKGRFIESNNRHQSFFFYPQCSCFIEKQYIYTDIGDAHEIG